MDAIALLLVSGLGAGLLAGLLGIGGGTVMVPILAALGYPYDQAVASSSLAIVITATSGTVQNWRMGFLLPSRVIALALPAIATAQVGAFLVETLPDFLKEAGFGSLLLLTICLVRLKKRLIAQQLQSESAVVMPPPYRLLGYRLGTGAAAGLLAGLFGVGGGVIMVPLQMLLLGEPIKAAIRTSLGVIVITSISACIGHFYYGNVVAIAGLSLGMGGFIGAQVSTRFLPKLPDRIVDLSFRALLIILAIYFFWRAWLSYGAIALAE